MNKHNSKPKIFARRLARELQDEELEAVGGGISTIIRNTGPYGGGEGSDTDAVHNDTSFHW
jgi:hypothetical protein